MSLVGSRIGRYDIISEIGTGGMASVYLARSAGRAGVRRLVAIKVMHPHLTQDDQFVDMFLDEARVASAIHHPNVVPIIDVGQEDDLIFLIMDYVEGDSLSNVEKVAVALRRRIPLGITLRICLDALSGLHAAHELYSPEGQHLKIIHRDVSPQNIVIGVDGSSRIVDFGIAKAESRNTHTQVGMIKGKLNFMAPEQLRSQPLDRRVDIFGMGVTLWEAITLRRLFAGANDFETASRILKGEYPSLLEFDPKLPSALDEIVRRSLLPDPNDRFATAEEFAEAIETELKAHIAGVRDVAAFISGVASQKLDRERSAVREQAASSEDDPMGSTLVEGGRRRRETPSANPALATLPNAGTPRARGDASGQRSKVRAPTLAMPVARDAPRRPAVEARAPTPPTRSVGEATVPGTPASRFRPPAPAAPAARGGPSMPSEPPGDPTVAMDIPVPGMGHLSYEDDGDTEMFAKRNAAPAAFRPSRQPTPEPEPEPEPEFEGARTLYQPTYDPSAAAPLNPTGGVVSRAAAERTLAIDLVQRRAEPEPAAPYPPPQSQSQPQGGYGGAPSGPFDAAGPSMTYGMPPTGPTAPKEVARPAGLSPWVYVFISVALVSVASALLWFVLSRQAR
jgi:serine/threonine protein kinase